MSYKEQKRIKKTSLSVAEWNKHDTTWVFALMGTAIGAGVLFFPIRAGYGGLLPMIIMIMLSYPIAFLCHRALARLCFSGPKPSYDIIETVEFYFGSAGGTVLTIAYFLAIYPILFIYGVTITNTFMAFWEIQLHMPALNRGLVAFVALFLLALIILFGKGFMIKVMGYLVYPLIACLLLISALLIPYWKTAIFTTLEPKHWQFWGENGIVVTVWLGIALMVFSFSFAAIVSSFVVSQRTKYQKQLGLAGVEKKCNKILSRACILMIVVIMLFSLSCLFTLSASELAEVKRRNIPILSYLAVYVTTAGGSPYLSAFLEYAAPLIALIAVFKSFFGHYLGALEGLNGLIICFGCKRNRNAISPTKLNFISLVIIMITTWIVAYLNPNILDLIEALGAPIIAFLLCLLPIYAIHKLPVLAKYRGQFANYFVLLVGILTYLNILYKLL